MKRSMFKMATAIIASAAMLTSVAPADALALRLTVQMT